jgi:pectin methylesterase-like acyl-CoA thioesterase
MTHLHSKRLPGPGLGRTLAAVVGLVAALGLGSIGQAKAATAATTPYALAPATTPARPCAGRDQARPCVGHGRPDRPQLSDTDAATFTVADYLAGTDGWAPYTRR